jgi:hypothetical protein
MAALRDLLARCLRHAKMCRATCERRDHGVAVYVRRRLWHAPLSVPLGNLLLDRLHVGVRFLPNRAWRRWEVAVYHALGTTDAAEESAAVVVPAFTGVTVAEYLSRPELDDQSKTRAARASLISLRRAHQVTPAWPDGECRTFSHGDATVRNVVYDAAHDVACWIDFESLHDPTLFESARRADDLRAWFVSAWECWPRTDQLVQLMVEAYDDAEAVTMLGDMLVRREDNIYHLAQGQMPRAERSRLGLLLRDRLRR